MELRLLIPNDAASDATSSARIAPTSAARNTAVDTAPVNKITVDGRDWVLSGPLDIEDDSLPEYACISYRWGLDRETHALSPDRMISTHTIPSLVTVMRSRNDRAAFWTDVFCIPSEEGPSRQATLENLGYIYARATEVVVVLGRETFEVLQDIIQTKLVSEPDLQILESDQWIASVWTYQELVNASAVRFVSEQHTYVDDTNSSGASTATRDGQSSIESSDFLNALGHGLVKYQQSQGADAFAVMRDFPNLNILENVLVDWMMSAYTRYSALSVFSNVCSKHSNSAANYYYAILGALSDSPRQLVWPSDETDETLAEKTMKLCESKSDFSFIYSIADRDPNPRRRWRPQATSLPPDGEVAPPILRPILVWHYWGEKQSGTFNEEGQLCLHGMTIMRCADPPHMSDIARVVITKWLGGSNLPSTDDVALARLVYTCIRSVGFEGEADPIIVPDGLVFPLHLINQKNIANIMVSNQISFRQGAPGLVRYRDSGGEKRYSPCLFIGSTDRLLEPGESVFM